MRDGSRQGRLPRGWRWLAVLVAALLVAVMVWRRPLADYLWPRARAEALRIQATQALSRGRLSVDDGSGARELYEASLVLDPDREDARLGLAHVASAALARATVAITQDRIPDAQRDLALARELDAPRAQVAPVERMLHDYQLARARIPQLLAQAAAARAAHRLDGDAGAALPLYQRILALRPRTLEALEGREDALADLLQGARDALARGDLADASARAAAARGYDPGHAGLPGVEAALANACERLQGAQAVLLREQHGADGSARGVGGEVLGDVDQPTCGKPLP